MLQNTKRFVHRNEVGGLYEDIRTRQYNLAEGENQDGFTWAKPGIDMFTAVLLGLSYIIMLAMNIVTINNNFATSVQNVTEENPTTFTPANYAFTIWFPIWFFLLLLTARLLCQFTVRLNAIPKKLKLNGKEDDTLYYDQGRKNMAVRLMLSFNFIFIKQN